MTFARLLKCVCLPVVLFGCRTQAASLAKGADVSWLPQMEATGYVFRDDEGKPADCLAILKAHGIDTIRLRVWVNPSEHPRSGHCSPAEVVELAARARKMGFRILLDFHYSDTWADPKQQTKPKAWAEHDFATLKRDVYDHTHAVLKALQTRGVMPEWVQIGNETRDGMLWPDGRMSDHGQNFAELINEGYRATKSIDLAIKVIVHLDQGQDNQFYRWFFDRLEKYGGHYDVIGLSYYPYWLEGRPDYRQTIDDLGRNLVDLVGRYHKPVMVVEVGGPSTEPAETQAMLTAVLEKMRAIPDGNGLGVVYWEPQAAASWSHYPLSCWGNDGRPTQALDAFRKDP